MVDNHRVGAPGKLYVGARNPYINYVEIYPRVIDAAVVAVPAAIGRKWGEV